MKYLLLLILFLGCEDKTFTRIYDKNIIARPLHTLNISENNQSIKNMAIEAFKKSGFHIQSGALYVVEIEGAHYPKKCNNPQATAYDATYDGYAKLTLLKGLKRLYVCQKDFHGALDSAIIEALIQKMKQDLKLP